MADLKGQRRPDPDDDLADLATKKVQRPKRVGAILTILVEAIVTVPWIMGLMLVTEMAWRALRLGR